MEELHIAIYILCDDFLNIIQLKDDPQCTMTNAEIVAFTIISAKLTAGNHKNARWILKKLGYFPNILSESRLSRRIRNIPWNVWHAIFKILAFIFEKKMTLMNMQWIVFLLIPVQKAGLIKDGFFWIKIHRFFCFQKTILLRIESAYDRNNLRRTSRDAL